MLTDPDILVDAETQQLPIQRDEIVNLTADRRGQHEVVLRVRRNALEVYGDLDNGRIVPKRRDSGLAIVKAQEPTEVRG